MRINWTGKITDEFYVLGHASVPVYLLDGPFPALFDAGFTSLAQVYEKGIREVLGTRSPSYLFLTHAHWDHIGSAAYFKAVWPQLQVVGSQRARDIVTQSKVLRRIRAFNQDAIGALMSWGVPQVYEGEFEPPVFDQVVSFSGGNITYSQVISNLNILDYDYYFRLTDSALQGDVPAMLLLFNDVLSRGFDSRNFLNGYASHLRDLMVSKDPQTVQLMEVGAGIRERYLEQGGRTPLSYLYGGLDICNLTDAGLRSSRNQRLSIEMALVKLANLSGEQKKK